MIQKGGSPFAFFRGRKRGGDARGKTAYWQTTAKRKRVLYEFVSTKGKRTISLSEKFNLFP